MSYTIPEFVLGIPLFVPTEHDFFDIETGGMPNGDACLKVLGATNRNGKAFCPTPLVTPNLFRTRNPPAWSMTFWLKCPIPPLAAQNNGYWGVVAYTLFSVSNSDFVASPNVYDGTANVDYSMVSGSTYGTTHNNYLWAVALSRVTGPSQLTSIGFTNPRTISGTAGGSGARAQTAAGSLDNAWHMWTLHLSPSTCCFYKDNAIVPSYGSMDPIDTAGLAVTTPMYLCVGGGYSPTATGPDVDWRIGKLSFHDHLLNSTERGLLYSAMIVSTTVTKINKGPSQADPGTGSTVTFAVEFSKSVTGFGIADVLLSGTAGATTVGVSGTGTSYIVTVSGMTTPGTVIANIPAGVVTAIDGSTNQMSTSTDNSVVWS